MIKKLYVGASGLFRPVSQRSNTRQYPSSQGSGSVHTDDMPSREKSLIVAHHMINTGMPVMRSSAKPYRVQTDCHLCSSVPSFRSRWKLAHVWVVLVDPTWHTSRRLQWLLGPDVYLCSMVIEDQEYKGQRGELSNSPHQRSCGSGLQVTAVFYYMANRPVREAVQRHCASSLG